MTARVELSRFPSTSPTSELAMLTSEPVLAPGTAVGNYRIERVVGEGGMAVVYEACHRVLPRRVAIKVMRAALVADAARERLLREACVLAELEHPAIVDVYDAGVLADGRAWLAMELVAGLPLSERLTHGKVAVEAARRWLALIADAIAVAHAAGVIHRDLKPDNVLLVDDPACPVRVIDWGIALDEACFGGRLTLDGAVTGTPHYMAPEQARGLDVDGRCDVYALGVVAYEMLTGVPPFDGTRALAILAHHLTTPAPSVLDRAPGTPAWFATLVAAMLGKDPAQRPSMAAVAAELLAHDGDAVATGGDDDYEVEVSGAPAPEGGPVAIELVADMLEDELAADVDAVIAAIAPARVRSRLAQGSSPAVFGGLAGVVWGEILVP
ncbi:MAG: serine/threonine protein kinase [Deltaproteobacteria bacterium]|nr:serine/threonine protein kinase [Deltaproteobacteria bacterium]